MVLKQLGRLCSFVSTPDPVGNKYYLGPAPLMDMARWAFAPSVLLWTNTPLD
jgi:hypothetical protein